MEGLRGVKSIALTSTCIALVTMATLSVNVHIPATKGYFNVGEVMIYTVSLLFGPKVGALAGGLGSALADVLGGYLAYAPATFVIKGLEGLIVGRVARIRLRVGTKAMKASGLGVASCLGILLWSLGSRVYVGAELELAWSGLRVPITSFVWAVLACLAGAVVLLYLWRAKPENLSSVVAILAGGSVMISGYYLYEWAVMGVFALAEVPVNMGQMLIGLTAAIPLYTTLKPKVAGIAGTGY